MDAGNMRGFVKVLIIGFQVVVTSALSTSNVTQEPVSGSDLYCYECKEIYKKGYDPLNSPCRNNVTTVGVRQCLPEHRYCVTEKTILKGWSVYSIARTCITDCFYGCKFNGFAVTTQVCYSCCRTPRCNTDNGATFLYIWGPLVVITVAILSCLTTS